MCEPNGERETRYERRVRSANGAEMWEGQERNKTERKKGRGGSNEDKEAYGKKRGAEAYTNFR